MEKCHIGLIGLGVMGSNLALNIESRGYRVAVHNRSWESAERFLAQDAKGKNVLAYRTLEELVSHLERPRKLILMVKAGAPVDELLERLTGLLEAGDIVIDGGNSLYGDTERRSQATHGFGMRYVGMGVSGGEEGARHGPSLMPGGEVSAYKAIEELLQKIAAPADTGPCVTYIGKGSSGHFVKMVHNGIEYGDMQLIAEVYDLLRKAFGLKAAEIAEVFEKWNQTSLQSYLIEITAHVLRQKDAGDKDTFLVDRILDKAGQKGTGLWTVTAAMEEGVAIPTIAAAVDARLLSSLKTQRDTAARLYGIKGFPAAKKLDESWTARLAKALYAAKICSYAQGFALLASASESHGYGIRLSEVARIWKGGCIIRAVFLDRIRKAFEDDPSLPNLLLSADFKEEIAGAAGDFKETLRLAADGGIAVPALSASFNYWLGVVTSQSPANLIQAQRDYFGAHTYQRTDREGTFHTVWTNETKRSS